MGTIERWLPVVGSEGIYEVSDLGRVRSLDRVSEYSTIRRGVSMTITRRHKGLVLRPGTMKSGHQLVVLGRALGAECVHVLVLTAFVGPRPDGHESLHYDDDPANNRLSNLAWGTRSQNLLDAVRNGKKAVGSRHQNAKLNEADIPEIRRLSATTGAYQIAERYGVHPTTIYQIIDGKTWKHVPAAQEAA